MESPSEFAPFAASYRLPARDPGGPRPVLQQPWNLSSWLDLWRGRLRTHDRRLAYLDSTFPWTRSGFRYHEALALHTLLPDTLFFSTWEMTDPFPAPVLPLAEFPRIAARAGITDVYGVFMLFLESITGMRREIEGEPHPMEGLDISGFANKAGIRMHGTIFPGGGFTPTADGYQRARELVSRLDTTFSYVPEVLDNVPGVTYVAQALTETRFYERTEERWERQSPLICMFAADGVPRKGLEVALGAFADLDARRFHLHVVGPHEHRRSEFPAGLVTFHGWLGPGQLRELHRETHVFLSPVSAEPKGPPGSLQRVTDGFPTLAAADAMSGGVLLVSANPADDHRVLVPGEHYIDLPAEVGTFRQTLLDLAAEPERAKRLAEAGSNRVRERMDVRRGVAQKLAATGMNFAGATT